MEVAGSLQAVKSAKGSACNKLPAHFKSLVMPSTLIIILMLIICCILTNERRKALDIQWNYMRENTPADKKKLRYHSNYADIEDEMVIVEGALSQ